MTVLPRSAWTTAPHVSGRVVWSGIRLVNIHWPASAGRVGTDLEAVKRALRSWWLLHTRDRGWRDIAYNVGVDQAGRIWELRGWDRIDGGVANRSDDVTILCILGMAERPSDAMKRGVLTAMAEFDRRAGRKLRRTHHGALSSTSCPGPDLTAWSKAGFPPPVSTAVPEEDIMASLDDLRRVLSERDTRLHEIIRHEAVRAVEDILSAPITQPDGHTAPLRDVIAWDAYRGRLLQPSVAGLRPEGPGLVDAMRAEQEPILYGSEEDQ